MQIKQLLISIAKPIGIALTQNWLAKLIRKLYSNVASGVVTTLFVVLLISQGHTYYNQFAEMYREANEPKEDTKKDGPGLEFKKIDQNLYTLTGSVKEGDCDKIVPLMPQKFTVILESPGGNLAEGSCLAAHFKIRDVITVVRNTPVLNELGKEIYTPGLVGEALDVDHLKDKTVCASACGLLFLGGDKRYLIGDVWLGIHGPGTPDGAINNMNRKQLESSSFRTAANLLKLLTQLGVDDEEVRILFIQIPNHSMYWLKPNDFKTREGLVDLATHYVNFWGLTASNMEAGME